MASRLKEEEENEKEEICTAVYRKSVLQYAGNLYCKADNPGRIIGKYPAPNQDSSVKTEDKSWTLSVPWRGRMQSLKPKH